MSRFEEVQEENKARRQRVLDGKLNCIPFPFKRYRKFFPGFERGRYIIITANQKVGKSKLSDYLFIYEPLFYMMEHPELKVKVLYFSLEMSAKEKFNEFLCHLLFRLDGIHISPRELRSVDRPCDEHIMELLETERYQKYIKAFENMVIYNDTDKNPTGIKVFCENYALEHGHQNFITYKYKNPKTGEIEDRRRKDPINPYTQDDEDEYRVIILDNAANVVTEKGVPTERDAIRKVSKDGINLKKDFKYIFVLIQHQAQAQEGIENFKLNKLLPSSDGLGDNKTTIRDVNCIIGLFNPAKHELNSFKNYDINKFKNYIRFLNFIDDRDSDAAGKLCPLFFDGATSTFKELPYANESEKLSKYYALIEKWEKERDESSILDKFT